MYRMIKADEELFVYKGTRGPVSESDKDFVADSIAWRIKQTGRKDRESVIEMFRSMNDDYDDWWARGLRTRQQEQEFLDDLADRLAARGIEVEV